MTETGFSAADDLDARSVVFVFIQINTFTYLRKMSIYQTNSVYVKIYLFFGFVCFSEIGLVVSRSSPRLIELSGKCDASVQVHSL